MSEWVLESDWSKVNVGDRVRLVSDAGSVEGVVRFEGPRIGVLGHRVLLRGFGNEWRSTEWSLFVVPKPTAALPTEPGWYGSAESASVNGLLHLSTDGKWSWVGNQYAVAPDEQTPAQLALHGTLTRLESQADTARKILERIQRDNTGDGGYYDHRYTGKQLRELFAEFGVTL